MLKTLQEMGLHDICAVTTRYFGGIKLGAGGLIRAYSNSVSNAVNQVGIVERRLQKQVTIEISYAQLGSVQHYLEAHTLPMTINYAVNVEIETSVPESALDSLQNDLTNLLSGQLSMTIGDDEFIEIPVTTTKKTPTHNESAFLFVNRCYFGILETLDQHHYDRHNDGKQHSGQCDHVGCIFFIGMRLVGQNWQYG